jgi:hypothetical protein
MTPAPGHIPGLSWGELIGELVSAHGTLSAVAWKLVAHAEGDDVASIERALRRLRTRGMRDGGVWGQRVLRVFGVPAPVEDRLRWMGLYHSPFNDLPVEMCLDQLRLWDHPPISESRARAWIRLGFASCALRSRRFDDAIAHCARVTGDDAAQIERALIEAYVASRTADPMPVLARAAELLAAAQLSPDDRACFEARLVDQRAYQASRAGDHRCALALYERLPTGDVHPFASYRRDAGRAGALARLGERESALELARRAIDHAGDGGYTRLRAMGLLLLAKIAGDRDALARARAIALRLGDQELVSRVAQLG